MGGKASVPSPAILKKSNGAQNVGYGEATVARILDEMRQARDVDALFSAAFNVADLRRECLIKKLRPDYPEFCVYTPMTADGRWWHRWLFTNRFNLGNAGAPRMLYCTLAALFTRNSIARHVENKTTGTTAVVATVTKTNADTTSVGVWSAPATTNGVTDVSWADAAGETKTFTITGCNRILLRGLSAGNGGIGYVRVYEDAGKTTEIGESLYLSPSDRKVNFNTSNGLILVPIAEGLDDTHEYTIEIGVHADNTPGNRVYFAGMLGYPTILFDDTGLHGVVDDAELPGGSGQINGRVYYSGTRGVYFVPDCTRIDVNYVSTGSGGIIDYQVFDASGNEMTGYYINESIDTFQQVSSTARVKTVVSGMPRAGYYIAWHNTKNKNASATGNRYYDYGFVGVDETEVGEFGVTPFDDMDVPLSILDPNNDNGLGSDYLLIGQGNIEMAFSARQIDDPVGSEIFYGGIHGHETTPTLQFFDANGNEIDYAGAAQYDEFIASGFNIPFETQCYFIDIPEVGDPIYTDWLNVEYTFNLSQCGYAVNVKKTTLIPVYGNRDYIMMLVSPNTSASAQGKGVGGGFKHVAADKNYICADYDNTFDFIGTRQRSAAFVNSEFAVGIRQTTNPISGVESDYSSFWTSIHDRTKDVKFYVDSFNGDKTNGVYIPAGTVIEDSKIFLVAKGNFMSLFGIKGV